MPKGQAATRQPQEPGRGASHLLPAGPGRSFPHPCAAGPAAGARWRGAGAGREGSGGRFSPAAAPRPRAQHPPSPRGPRGQARCDWPARPGAGPGGPVARDASKEPRKAQSALEPRPARSPPGAGKLGLGNAGSPWLARLYKLLDLTCLCNPPLPRHVPMLLRRQQVRAAVCFLPSFPLVACAARGVDSGCRPRPSPAPPPQRCPAVTLP